MLRKLIVLALVLTASAAFGRQAALYVGTGAETPDIWDGSAGDAYFGAGEFESDATMSRFDGDVTLGDAAGDVITVTGTMALTQVVSFPDGAVGAPAITFTSDPDSGVYVVGANDLGIACGGAQVSHYDATGVTAVGFNGPIGTVVPAQGEFTNIYGSADFYYGQNPGDLHEGYTRTERIKYTDGFDHGSDAHLAVIYDLTNVVGAGTNTTNGTPGWNTLVTGGAGGPDMESTRSNNLLHYRAYEPRLECVVDLTAIAAGQSFFFGFWAAANEFAQIIHEPATSANWLVRVDDTGGATTHDTGILAAAGTPTKLEIWVNAAGDVNAAIDDVDVACAGLDPMTANPHYAEWRILDVAAAAHTVAIDYIVSEQLKVQ